MPANPWELRADVRPLEAAAVRWTEVATVMARRGDEIVDAARRATEGWDAAAAESYEQHRRQVLVNLDRFTTLATQVAGSLRAISAVITSSQGELDRAWTKVALVPHEFVGESRYLVFRPSEDDDKGKVTQGQSETEEIRRQLTMSLDQESTRLRTARAEFVMVRTELTTLTGGTFGAGGVPGLRLPGLGPGGQESGVGTIMPPSTSVLGSGQSGVALSSLPPVAPISVSMPHLTGLSAAALAPFAATAAGGLAGRSGARRTTNAAAPPMGGMGVGAMGARAGTMSRGMASGRSGPARLATPQLPGTSDEEAARIAREKQAAKEAKQAALADKRAERAARKAEREKDRDNDEKDDTSDETAEPDETEAQVDGVDAPGERPAAITVVHYSPGEAPRER
ncbi:hypothetical protein [Nocardioides zhouii]|uniref:Uncharacterized protein n=1 Tax=Nocardioides zhouii TaxID=1168729 RepID=A0A4Q2SP06_9ACTN|nr:hypothetical protein [Nocardioides zhouii]RYC07435.1 hypothetical protein EUA94_14145 [Nocardioides zhouii]